MSITVEFLGAARTVTGSMHLVRTAHANVLLDCGLYQGRRRESYERNRDLPVRPADVDVIVLSHAHIDHSGALPSLVKSGYRGDIYVTPATRDLCAAMLEDAANIQMHDAAYVERQIREHGSDMEHVEPLYDLEDVKQTLSQMICVPYRRPVTIAHGVKLVFHDAGHVLGSAVTSLDLDDEGATRRLTFSGDLGRHDAALLRDPEVPSGTEILLCESTYGDRLHGPVADLDERLSALVTRVAARGGKVIIPTFALERAQEVIVALRRLRQKGTIPAIPVYVDSPLTLKVTGVFRLHPECFDDPMREAMQDGDSPFDFEGLRYIDSVEASKRLTADSTPAIVLSASGMCENGRILHHLRATIADPKNAVAIVGFQAQHTLGRRLVEGRDEVRIFGVMHARRAEVVVFDGLSAHADRDDLVAFIEACREHGKLRTVALVHGEPDSLFALRDTLNERGFPDVRVPERGDSMTV